MTDEERRERLESYRKAPEQIWDVIQQFPREMWRFKPTPEDWSILEIMVHLLDGEINAYIRYRKAIAEPGSSITSYDAGLWAATGRYQNQNLDEALDLFRSLRVKNYQLLSSLPQETWANTVEHPKRGALTLDDLLITFEEHVSEHLLQAWKVYQAWVDQDW